MPPYTSSARHLAARNAGWCYSDGSLTYVDAVHDADVIAPRHVALRKEIEEQTCDLVRTFRADAQEQNTGSWSVGATHCEFAEVPIEGHNESVFANCSFQEPQICCARLGLGGRIDVVPGGTQGTDGFKRNVFVCQQAHYVVPGRTGRSV